MYQQLNYNEQQNIIESDLRRLNKLNKYCNKTIVTMISIVSGFPPKRPSVTAPWRFNFLPWRFSKCRDASVSAVTLQKIP